MARTTTANAPTVTNLSDHKLPKVDEGPRPGRDLAFTAIRSLALVVVVLWHWVFATVRWDATGPHSGNPLHVVPAGFVLTWFLQVMPVFFLVGGWASCGSLLRHRQRNGSDRAWVSARISRLARPALPLAAGLVVAKLLLSPWLFGVILLAASPLWFLGVYLPLTALTPVLMRWHRRSPAIAFGCTAAALMATEFARFGFGSDSTAMTLAALLTVWGFIYQVGFYLETLRANPQKACVLSFAGIVGIGVCVAMGLPASMVAVKGDVISNMGPPTVAIVMLGLFQAGLIAMLADRFGRVVMRPTIGSLIRWIDTNQMTIYIVHLPIWVIQLVVLRHSVFGLADTPTLGWLATRPLWLIGPGFALLRLLSVLRLVPKQAAR